MNFTVRTAAKKWKSYAAVMSTASSVLPAEKMPVKSSLTSGPAEAQPEAEPPPQVVVGELKPAAAVAEPV
jgi:hypothetical protein